MEKMLTGKAPNDLTMKTFATMPGGLPPSVTAGLTMAAGYDFYADKPTWTGMNVSEYMKYDTAPKRPTAEIWKWAGSLGVDPDNPSGYQGMSPAALETAFRSVVPNNDYINLAGAGLKWLTNGYNDYEQAQSATQMLANMPLANRVFSLTSPVVNEIEELSSAEARANDPMQAQINQMREMAFRVQQGQVPERSVQEWVKTQPGEDADRLLKMYQHIKYLDKAYRETTDTSGMPSKSWWIRSGAVRGEARAEVFFERWREATPRQQALMESTASKLTGYRSEEFERTLHRLRKERGG
jgi:hypothetical protein